MNRTSQWLLGLTVLLTLLMLTVFGWGHGNVKRYRLEPTTKLTATNTDSLYSETAFEQTMKKYTDFNTLALIDRVQGDTATSLNYRDFAIIPGLKATRTLNLTSGEIEMCTTMTPQGVTIAGQYLISSAYDHDQQHNSVLYVQDLTTHKLLTTVVLQGHPHVGGITYDPIAKQVWVCGRRDGYAEVFSIALNKLVKYDLDASQAPIKYTQRVLLGTISRASFITYHDQSLYVGFFNPRRGGNVQRYQLSKTGRIENNTFTYRLKNQLNVFVSAVFRQDILTQIQGMAFYDGYAILSQSYGPGNSKLYIFKEDKTQRTFRKSEAVAVFKMPSHLEQISAHDGRLYTIYESSAYAYRKNSHNHIDRIVSMDLKDFINLVLKGAD